MSRNVLIGKGRRVTLDELLSVALGDGRLQLYAVDDDNDNEPTATSLDVDATLAAIKTTSLSDHSSSLLLSPEATLASLTLLGLGIHRLLPTTTTTITNSTKDMIISAIVDLVNLIQTTKTPLRLSCTSFLSSLLPLLPTSCQEILSTTLVRMDEAVLHHVVWLAVGSLATIRALSLARAATPIAALSAEQAQVHANVFSEHDFDINRPHRALITTAAILRAILQGSKYCNDNMDTPTTTTTTSSSPQHHHRLPSASSHHHRHSQKAILTIPQYHGPAQEHLHAAVKTLELEFNCANHTTHDDTVAVMAMRQALEAVTTLLEGSQARQNQTALSPTIALTNKNALAMTLETTVNALHISLLKEAQRGCKFVTDETNKVIEEARVKEEQKAIRAKELLQTTSTSTTTDGDNDEFAGMSQDTKAKILKKRAEKEAKAAAKRATKKDKVSIFGAGTQLLVDVLSPQLVDTTTHNATLTQETIQELEDICAKLLSGGVQRKPKIPKGTRDYLPEQMKIRQQAFAIIRRVFESHGAVEIDTPVFELKETLTGKYGEDSKLIYDLADQGGELLALRYDLTVPFARFLSLNAVGNIKRFHIGKVYRRDQPALARGRYREFYQCDFDIAGTYGRMVPDSECLCVACEILDKLPIGDFGIKLNHRRLLDAILDICGVPADKFRTICSAVDKLDKEPWEEVRREMVDDKGLKPQVADKIGTFVLEKGDPWTMYNKLMASKKFGKHKGALEAMEDLKILFEYLEAMGKLQFISFDLSLARGLDYYTGVIYEAVCMNGNTQVGSIGGGGRYDNLVSMFQEAGKVTPCVGVSVGIERVFTLMEAKLREEQGTINQPNCSVLVASVGDGMMVERMKIAKLLWDANISAEFSQQENAKLKYELANALQRGIPFVAIVGEEEVQNKTCKVKNLEARTEETVPISELVSTLRKMGVIPVGCEFAAELLQKEA